MRAKAEKNLRFVKGRGGRPDYYVTDFRSRGRRVRRFAGYTKAEARDYVSRLRLAAREEGGLDSLLKPEGAQVMIFGEYARGLLDSSEWKAKRSHERDEGSLKRLNRAFRNTQLAHINPGAVRKYITTRKEGDGMAAGTVNRELSFLKSVLYRAEYDELIESNPIRGRRVKKLEEANHREKAILDLGLTDSDLERLVDSAADYLQPILKVVLTTGMRQGEILRAKWTDLSVRLKTLRVPAENSKSKRERLVPLDPDLCAELDSWPRTGDYIFSNPETGTRRKDVRESFRLACEAAGIKTGRAQGLVFHDLRHVAAYHLVKATDVVTASKILGHSSLDMTLRYVHPTEKDKHLAVEKVAETLFQRRGQKKAIIRKSPRRKEAENREHLN